MKKLYYLLPLLAAVLTFSCMSEMGDYGYSSEGVSEGYGHLEAGNGTDSLAFEAGQLTAAEWNDLDHWDFWKNLLRGQTDSTNFAQYPTYWRYSTQERYGLQLLHSDSLPVINSDLRLMFGQKELWHARTDNLGRAELWLGLTPTDTVVPMDSCRLYADGLPMDVPLVRDSLNRFCCDSLASSGSLRVELAFVVDATGSMGDEMNYLKAELEDVITRVQAMQSGLSVWTAAVFYRDEEDDYLVKNSDFTDQLQTTVDYIGLQRADGGGDYPEAVHTALSTTLSQLQWSEQARTRLAFLLLDAPPHYQEAVISDIHRSVHEFAAKGIKLIPVAASGIDKETEFLLRYFALATNGTYVFLTDDSGLGNSHLKASVGAYEVEYLNDLLVRLITKYSE